MRQNHGGTTVTSRISGWEELAAGPVTALRSPWCTEPDGHAGRVQHADRVSCGCREARGADEVLIKIEEPRAVEGPAGVIVWQVKGFLAVPGGLQPPACGQEQFQIGRLGNRIAHADGPPAGRPAG